MTLESIEQMRKWATLFDADNARRVHGFADWIEREIAEKYLALPLRPDGTPVNVGEVYDDPVLGEGDGSWRQRWRRLLPSEQ